MDQYFVSYLIFVKMGLFSQYKGKAKGCMTEELVFNCH
jgi:hypothetical protein